MASTSTEELSSALDEIMGMGGSVNLYMGHGGTNWGFWNGANVASGGVGGYTFMGKALTYS